MFTTTMSWADSLFGSDSSLRWKCQISSCRPKSNFCYIRLYSQGICILSKNILLLLCDVYSKKTKKDLLHITFQLVHGALVQVPAEEGEQVRGQEEWLHEGTLRQLSCHLEYSVSPKDNTNVDVKIPHTCYSHPLT